MALVVKGSKGVAKVGCQWAADLGPWTFTANAEGGMVQAKVLRKNEYWGARRVTDLRLTIGKQEWRWRGSAVDAEAGGGCYRVSGPPEE